MIGAYPLVKACIESFPTEPDRGCYWNEHEVVYGDERRPLDCDWLDTWGDLVYWVHSGRLHIGELTPDGLVGDFIENFNDMAFEAIEAPY